MSVGVHVSIQIRGFLDIYPGVGLLDRVQLYFQYFEDAPYGFPQWLQRFTFSPPVWDGSLFLYPLQHLLFVDFLTGVRWHLTCSGFHFSNN